MSKQYIKIVAVVVLMITLFSCNDITKEVQNWMEVNETQDVVGNYHYLENDGTKVFLPNVFNRYSSAEYENVLESVLEKKDLDTELKRLKTLRELEGNFYIYYDKLSRSTFTVNTMPYMPLYKHDAQMLLGIMRQSNEKMFQGSDYEFEKVKASYSSTNKLQVFKGVFKIHNKKTKLDVYESNYFVSSDGKTFFIKLTTGGNVDFDPYFKKFIL